MPTAVFWGVYRKTHIPNTIGYQEKTYFSPGDLGFRVWKTRYGNVGVGICWDQWFPETARCLALNGAEMLFFPTAIGSEPGDAEIDSRDHWQRVMQGHAGANIMPLVASNRIGVEKGDNFEMTFYGSSFISDHTGAKVAEANRIDETVLTATFDLDEIRRYREDWGVFRDRRPARYGALMTLDGESISIGWMNMNKLNAAINAETVLQHAEKIDVEDEWFDVIELPRDVYAIAEPGHWQHVISYLIIGAGKSVLFDTGMGISDISAVVKKLTDTEIMVVNSHVHFDHIGDDWRFPEIYVFADEHAVEVLSQGHSHDMLLFDSDPDKFLSGSPPGFKPEEYMIKPVDIEKIRQLAAGDVIDLGNRQLEVLHTPGHTNDSLVLFDRENRALFTGDTFYPDSLFAFMEGEWGQSNLSVYEDTMNNLAELVPGLDYVYPCHMKPLVDPAMLIAAAKAFNIVNKGEAEYKLEEYYFQTMRVYEFDGFEILTLDR